MSKIGKAVQMELYGASHEAAVGMVLEGIPAGVSLDMEAIQTQLARRAPGNDTLTSARRETDVPVFLSGVRDGVTTGEPIRAQIPNHDVDSATYDIYRHVPRPSHADYPARIKFGDSVDLRGGGAFSGRMTAPMTLAGAICRQLLEQKGITVGGHLLAVGDVWDEPFDPVRVDAATLSALSTQAFAVQSDEAARAMREAVADAKANGDSIGGVLELAAVGLPVGLGDLHFRGVESVLSPLLFAIPAVKGVSFGDGFAFGHARGTQVNDTYSKQNERVVTKSNHNGGIVGGLATGMPMTVRVAIKPTPSIAAEQVTLDLATGRDTVLQCGGRHDPCVAIRALAAAEAALCLGLADMMKEAGWL